MFPVKFRFRELEFQVLYCIISVRELAKALTNAVIKEILYQSLVEVVYNENFFVELCIVCGERSERSLDGHAALVQFLESSPLLNWKIFFNVGQNIKYLRFIFL
eukprot:sb/3478024/